MRAVVLRNGELTVRETPDPVPGPGELLCKTLSTAICASDVHFMDHPALAIDDPTGRSLYDTDRDIVLGHEFVGEVIGHGPGCTDQFPVGTRVTSIPIRLVDGGVDGTRIIGQHPEAQGSFGELLVIAEMLAKQVDDGVSLDAASLTDAFAVGEFYVRAANVQPGEIPIVIGAGAIGLSAVAALASRGIEPIVVSDFKAERRDLARDEFGAHVLVDPLAEVAVRRLQRASGGTPSARPGHRLRMRRRRRADPADRRVGRDGHPDLLRRRLVHRRHARHHHRDAPGRDHPVRRGPNAAGLVRHPRRDRLGRLDPMPSVGAIIGLDEVPHAIELARRSDGPPRIVVHPNAGASEATVTTTGDLRDRTRRPQGHRRRPAALRHRDRPPRLAAVPHRLHRRLRTRLRRDRYLERRRRRHRVHGGLPRHGRAHHAPAHQPGDHRQRRPAEARTYVDA